MIITINNDTLPNEMHHIAVALQRIAAENGYKAVQEFTVGVDVTQQQAEAAVVDQQMTAAHNRADVVEAVISGDVKLVVNTSILTDMELPPVVTPPTLADHVHTATDQPGATADLNPTYVAPPATDDRLDSSGLPWDARIHAGSRERNTDGSWRVRRRPKGVEEAEWEATLARVTSELRDLMEIPVTPGAVADAAAEEREIGDVHHTAHALTDAEVDQFVDTMNAITDDTPAPIAPPVILPPVVLPPVTITPPVIATETTPIDTFARVMTYLTARTPKVEAEKPAMIAKVNEILAANGLTVLTQLGQRPDLIPQIMAEFTAAFGE